MGIVCQRNGDYPREVPLKSFACERCVEAEILPEWREEYGERM